MYRLSSGDLSASCVARVVKTLLEDPRSPPPLEKKKLAPRRPCSSYSRAIVRAMVDFPVPAIPFSQKMPLSHRPSAHSLIRARTSTRVPRRQRDACCLVEELNAAWAAHGRCLSRSRSSRPVLQLKPSTLGGL